MVPVVEGNGGGYPIEGRVKRDFGRCKVEEVTIIQQAWREGGSAGNEQQRRDGRRRDRSIGDGKFSGERRTLW